MTHLEYQVGSDNYHLRALIGHVNLHCLLFISYSWLLYNCKLPQVPLFPSVSSIKADHPQWFRYLKIAR